MSSDPPKLGADFEAWGHWWLPGHEQDKVAGRLFCQGGNLELCLLGQFDEINVNKHLLAVPIIHGVANSSAFTLWNSVQGQFGFRVPGTVEQRFEHMRILKGDHLEDASVARFSGLRLETGNLGPWSGLHPVEFKWGSGDGEETSFRIAAKRSQEIALPEHGMVLTIGSSVSTKNERFEAYGFDVSPGLHVDFAEPLLFADIMSRAESLRRILTLLIGPEFVVEHVTLSEGHKNSKKEWAVLFEHMPPEGVKVLNEREVLVPLPVLGVKATDTFSAWFAQEPRIKDAVDLLVATVRHQALPTHVELTTLAQSLETFHRNVFGGGYLAKEEYEHIREILVAAIPAEVGKGHREALTGRIKYGYEFSFRKRLEKLLENFDDDLLQSIEIERELFPKDATDARNEFTHWDSALGKPRRSGGDLENMVSKLRALTRLVLLSHLHIPATEAARRMLDNRHMYLPKLGKVIRE